MKTGIIIPARLDSERLPNKVLRKFHGKYMIEHTWNRAQLLQTQTECVVVTDSNEILEKCKKFGAKVIKTELAHPNGMSRAKEAIKQLDWDYVVILQADELLVVPTDLENLIEKINMNYSFYNLITKIENDNEIENPNVVKCILKQDGSILHIFRRSGFISKPEEQIKFVKKICGTFAISKELLSRIDLNNSGLIGLSESIEQLSVLENNIEILGIEIPNNFISVNTADEALKAEEILKTDEIQKEIYSKYR